VLEDGFASLNGRRMSVYSGGRGDVMELANGEDWQGLG
jgi:N-hydroxyarylamine O-acetyltransferase